jgi:hypothetical protein
MITRLLTGEEILGDVEIETSGETCKITNPTQIGAVPNPKTGNVDVHMVPFAPLSSQKHVVFSTRNVLCQYEPVVDILNKYNSMFGSGLIIPKKPGIITSSK